jgi:hypothetical protein
MKRKFIDERGKFFGVISIVDLIVVAIVVVLAFAVYSRFFTNETTATAVTNDTFTYELALRNIRSYTVDSLSEGDVLYDSENDTYLGTISEIRVTPAEKYSLTQDGTYVLGSIENRVDAYITIDATGLISNGRYYASRTYEIGVNAYVSFYTKYLSSSGTVWSVG